MITTTSEWFRPDEKLPDKDGAYLVAVSRPSLYFCIIEFTKNLHEYSSFDFPDESDARPGFVDVDCVRVNWFFEVPLSNVLYWAEIPNIKEEQ